MSANSVNLPEYIGKDGSPAFAAKITRIEDCSWAQKEHPGAKTLWMDALDIKANMIPAWVRQHDPKVGGYFLVKDDPDGTTRCLYKAAGAFESEYELL